MANKSTVLALDLEGTLISNAMSQIPRPGLYDFLEKVNQLFSRVVMYTTVKEDRFRNIADLLVSENFAPDWFRTIEYVQWHGETKDLSFIPDARIDEALLVDDFEKYVHPGQEDRWIQIQFFDYPYPDDDTGLFEIIEKLQNMPNSKAIKS